MVFELRGRLVCTQEEFARRVGISSQQVSHWETGTAEPQIQNARRIMNIARRHGYPESEWPRTHNATVSGGVIRLKKPANPKAAAADGSEETVR
jgi:transcriptional regulator with XRE-family HTH domain